MKAYVMAAGALLMGTSAYAYDAGKGFDSKLIATPEKAEAMAQSQQMKKAVTDVLSDAKDDALLQPASAVTWDSTDAAAKWQPASAVTWDSTAQAKVDTGAGDPNLDLAVDPDSAVVADEAAAEAGVARGVGGPEEAVQVASADLAPRPAEANYPACRPGPGDDHCIQLYEPGVRQQLASWNQPTGGFADGTTQTAMGGPYEPVESAAATGAADEVMAKSDAVPQTLAYAGDGLDSGPLDDEGVV